MPHHIKSMKIIHGDKYSVIGINKPLENQSVL